VRYERASASFEPAVEEATITGIRGSVSWTCMGYRGKLELTHRDAVDEEGRTHSFAPPGKSWFARAPLYETLNLLEGRPHCAIHGGDALFQAAALCAIYRAAEKGAPVTVRREDFMIDPTSGTCTS
jgi:hypothetical protein